MDFGDLFSSKKSFLFFTIFGIGCTQAFVYYSYFNLNIFYYIEFNEILAFLFRSLLIALLVSFIIALILFYLLRKFKSKSNSEISRKNKSDKFKFLLLIFPILALIKSYLEKDEVSMIFAILLFSFFIIFFIKNLFDSNRKIILEKFKIKNTFTNYLFSEFLLIFISFSILNLSYQLIATYEGQNSITFTRNNLEFESNKDNLFVGESKNFIFIYSKKSKQTEVINKKDVTNLKFASKANFPFFFKNSSEHH